MCIYCCTNHYRKIYEQHNGPIPKEENGRSYEIHHIDGDHSNNDPTNLKCVTIQEHYDIHYSQGDYGACWLMTRHMSISPEEKSELARLNAMKRVAAGKHPFQKRQDGTSISQENQQRLVKEGKHPFQKRQDGTSISQETQQRLVKEGKHHLLGGELHKKLVAEGRHNLLGGDIQRRNNKKRIEDGTHHLLSGEQQKAISKKRVEDGTHHFLDKEAAKIRAAKRLANGTHTSQIKKTCEHCEITVSSNMYSRWHGDKCKNRLL